MFYKLEISYNDYYTVKNASKTKQEYLENILDNIKNSNSIELVKPSDAEFEELKNNGLYEIDLKLKKIKVIANEISLLSAILELNNFQIHLTEKDNLIRNSMPYLLNMAYDMENVEVLRDFNAWSWNALVNEIKDININLVYQNLKIAVNQDIFALVQNTNGYIDVVELIYAQLKKQYPEKIVDKFIELLFKISIIKYINISENENKRLKEEREIIEKELEEIRDKKLYINNISDQKKELTNSLKQIDLIMNNKEMLFEEYEKRNEKLSEYNKIFSISHLVERMQKERKRILEKIDICNKKVEPKTYIEDKNKLQKDYNLLKNINFEKQDNNIYKYIDKLQEFFIKDIFVKKIESLSTKSEMINCMYELRYYNFLQYNNECTIKNVEFLKQPIEEAKELLIKKLYDNKIITTFSTNEENDIKIVKNIFDLKIIKMESIYIEIRKKDDKYVIKAYDEKETLETEFETNLKFNKKDKIRLNKKVKLFKFER